VIGSPSANTQINAFQYITSDNTLLLGGSTLSNKIQTGT
jgi:hypothetical protein